MNIETIYESFFNTYRNVGNIIAELKQSTIDSALEKRKKERDSILKTQAELTDQGRIHGRRGRSNKPGSGGDKPRTVFVGQDASDIDQQVNIARKGLGGEKDKDVEVPDSKKSALEKRHKPPTRDDKPAKSDAGAEAGKTLYTKLSNRINKLASHRGTK
jgi:hypothetical protein